jgi:hypothetical protein
VRLIIYELRGAKEYLVDSVPACADVVITLLRDRERARDAGRRGQARVRENFSFHDSC